jgi:hypothetical protein
MSPQDQERRCCKYCNVNRQNRNIPGRRGSVEAERRFVALGAPCAAGLAVQADVPRLDEGIAEPAQKCTGCDFA